MNRRCKNCKGKYYSSKGQEHCRPCRRDLGLLTMDQNRRIAQKIMKDACGNAKDYRQEIMFYSVKQKWDLLDELDYYKIADLYLKIICDSFKYSQNEPKNQVIYMLSDLRTLLMEFPKREKYIKSGRSVVEIVDGKITRTWNSINKAATDLNITSHMVGRICDFKSKRRFYNLMWKKDYKPN
jgi:hypothetical protein